MPHPMPNLVIVLPGIMGSVLARNGDEVWAPSGGAVWNFLKTRSKSLKSLALDGPDDGSLDDLGDGVSATRLMPDIHLLPGLWSIDGYGAIRDGLFETFEMKQGDNYFEFPYDWRRHNQAHGRRLRKESGEWLKAWRQKSGNEEAKLILLAHSMGGLVARSFLELEGGWDSTKTLITFGTPYSGSLNALNFIANGFKKGMGPVGIDLSELVRSLTSIHQLLPTYPCIQTLPGQDLLRPSEAAVPHLDPIRATNAQKFHQALRDAAESHDKARVQPVVGIRQPTLQRAVMGNNELWVSSTWDPDKPHLEFGGDGTVPRRSATPPEMANDLAGTMYAAVQHGSLQNASAVLAHVEGLLTEQLYQIPEPNAAALKYVSLGLEDDYLAAGEELSLTLGSSEMGIDFELTVANEATGEVVMTIGTNNLDGADEVPVTVPNLAEGTYRVTARTPGTDTAPVSRVVVVWTDS